MWGKVYWLLQSFLKISSMACIARGVLCLTAKHKVRLLPALNIPMEQLKKAAEVILAVCAE